MDTEGPPHDQGGLRRCCRSAPHLHVLPHGGRNTEGPPHDQGGLCHRPSLPVETPPTIEAPNTVALKGPLRPPQERRCQRTPKTEALLHRTPSPPPQTHIASPLRGLPDLPTKRPKECLPQGRDGFDNHQTRHQDNHQPSDPTTTDSGMMNQRRGHALDPNGHRRQSNLATAAK
jgi:hypothetical protein